MHVDHTLLAKDDRSLCTQLGEPATAKAPYERTRLVHVVGAVLTKQITHRCEDAVHTRLSISFWFRHSRHPWPEGRELLQYQPATRGERGYELRHHFVTCSQMDKNETGMNQIEFCSGKRFAHYIMGQQLDVRSIPDLDPFEVEVGGKHSAGGADFLRQPSDDGSTTSADFETTPPWSHAAIVEMSKRRRVECALEAGEPSCSFGGRVVEKISFVGQSATMLRIRMLVRSNRVLAARFIRDASRS